MGWEKVVKMVPIVQGTKTVGDHVWMGVALDPELAAQGFFDFYTLVKIIDLTQVGEDIRVEDYFTVSPILHGELEPPEIACHINRLADRQVVMEEQLSE